MDIFKNKTALVTGASSGIGEAIARKLASVGVNLVLVARSQDKLTGLGDELTGRYGIDCSVFSLDLSKSGCASALLGQVESSGITVDILVNNAGFGTYGPFETISPGAEQEEIAVNIAAVVDLAHAFLPGMLERGSGIILNLASTSSFQPCPYMAVYGATKAFVLNFSEALWAEYRVRGIHVAALCPGPVETGFIGKLGDESVRKTSVFSSTIAPEQVATKALKAIQGKSPTYIIGLKNWLMAHSLRFVPRSLVARIAGEKLRPRTYKV